MTTRGARSSCRGVCRSLRPALSHELVGVPGYLHCRAVDGRQRRERLLFPAGRAGVGEEPRAPLQDSCSERAVSSPCIRVASAMRR